ncbi:hypothetical protein [Arthrobacter sp. C9C5]|uniref:hypothetical protein n=1 Tax=Arthrobacter sp. C9C5 TaxID=2735267 RepID=UPI0015847E2B|nr:hypothetical protein [Arthrobacter sp. C9C5]NUU32230.1 hypothetical protein [Arthrobacter sp. C9C5]
MPSLSDSAPLGAWQFASLALLVAAAVAGTVYLVRKHRASDGGLPDAVFWDGFAGVAIVAPAVLLPSLVSPWTGLMLAAVAVTTAAASYRWTPRLFRWQEARRTARGAAAADAAAADRHRAALARWQRYELDPAFCIDFPAMSDPARPETAAMLKAMKAAERLRHGACPDGQAPGGYSTAVDRLEQALAEAERAAGALQVSAEGAR